MKAYVNGDFVEEQDARVSVFDAGFLLGYGAFETMRSYGGKVFRLGPHLRRLNNTCTALGIPFQGEPAWLHETVTKLLNLNALTEARVRLTVTAGDSRTAFSRPTVVITAAAFTGTQPSGGLWRACLYRGTVNSHNFLRQHKTTSCLEYVMARKEAKKNGFEEALFVNEMGYITEGSITNVFCVRDGAVYTPPVEEGLLPGVTREVVAELSRDAGVSFFESKLCLADFVHCQEAFLTNSVIEIVPLIAIGDVQIGRKEPGPLTVMLQQAYRVLVRRELNIG
ncbi:MAG: aminotransferase class IV [Firmicutes bacterium]|nr:aminotransferase class IV [Bacillota bacterium]